jgi:hypothetical protein
MDTPGLCWPSFGILPNDVRMRFTATYSSMEKLRESLLLCADVEYFTFLKNCSRMAFVSMSSHVSAA